MKNPENVKKGDKIRVICMLGEPKYTGKIGVVEHIDDAGQLHGTWGGLAVIPDEDEFEIIEGEEKYILFLKNLKGVLFWKVTPFEKENYKEKIESEMNDGLESSSRFFPQLQKKNIETITCKHMEGKQLTMSACYEEGRTADINGNICFVIKKKEYGGLSKKEVKEILEIINAPTKIFNSKECLKYN